MWFVKWYSAMFLGKQYLKFNPGIYHGWENGVTANCQRKVNTSYKNATMFLKNANKNKIIVVLNCENMRSA